MGAEKLIGSGSGRTSLDRTSLDRTNSDRKSAQSQNGERERLAGREFARRFSNLLCELRLQPGIHQRIETLLEEFADAHPNVRASYLSREVDETYFSDGSCGWEANARPKLQGIAIADETLYEFLAFANGLRMHTTPLDTIMNVEELWLEPATDQPFVLRACLFHSFPATTILYAPHPDTQQAAVAFLHRLKYLRGF